MSGRMTIYEKIDNKLSSTGFDAEERRISGALHRGPAGEPYARPEHLYAFDLVRIIAFLSIILFHFNVELTTNPFTADLARPILALSYANGTLGDLGVSLFFILSGASLMHVHGDEERLDLKSYYRKRFLGIYPLFWLAYLAVSFYHYVILHYQVPDAPAWTIILTILGMDGMLYEVMPDFYLLGEWFLGCLILLYLVFPILRALVKKAPLATIAGCGVVTAIVWNIYALPLSPMHFFVLRIPEFLFGMYFARYLYRTPLDRKSFRWLFGAGLLLAVVVWLVPLPVPHILQTWAMGVPLFLGLIYIGDLIWKPESEKRPLAEKLGTEEKQIASGSQAASLKKTPVRLHGHLEAGIAFYAKFTYALFLVHHVFVYRFVIQWTGGPFTPFSNAQLYWVFLKYLIYIHIWAFVLYQVNRLIHR